MHEDAKLRWRKEHVDRMCFSAKSVFAKTLEIPKFHVALQEIKLLSFATLYRPWGVRQGYSPPVAIKLTTYKDGSGPVYFYGSYIGKDDHWVTVRTGKALPYKAYMSNLSNIVKSHQAHSKIHLPHWMHPEIDLETRSF